MLQEIQAAIRASVISPSEDAKEKLGKLHLIVIAPKSDTYSMEIRLTPTGSLTMEELRQAFQLLDMAVVDDCNHGDNKEGDIGDLVGRTRHYVGLIESLSKVFGLLFSSGCITYTFTRQIVIELENLETEIKSMQNQLDEWINQWKEIEKMPLLALLSRGYLLELSDMIGRNKMQEVMSIFKFVLPSAPLKMENLVKRLVEGAPRIGDEWLSTVELFRILEQVHQVIEAVFHDKSSELVLPPFLTSYAQTLNSHFDKPVVILNVSRELVVGSSLAAYISVTRRPIEPSRIFFVTANTDKQELDRFMTIWSLAEKEKDFFIIAHVERLTAAGANTVREGVNRVLPERRAKLLLVAQQHHNVQSTKSLGARLGLVSDRLLEVHFTFDQLRDCFSTLLPNAANLHFFTSTLPGCGKSQQAMVEASARDYYRIPVRIGSVEELLVSLKKVETLSSQDQRSVFLHLDVAHSVSLEFNDILLSLLIHGALYDPKKAKLGFWMISKETTIAVEFASPLGIEEFPIISYLGRHRVCKCNKSFFTYDLARMPPVLGQSVAVNQSAALVVAGKFLQLKQTGEEERLRRWDDLCISMETLMVDPIPEDVTFELLVNAFHHAENRLAPTFSSLNAMASFLHRHVSAMTTSFWFKGSSLFEDEKLDRIFRLNVFNILIKVANDCITRSWSIENKGAKIVGMNWIDRQRAMFLLGFNEDGSVAGMNIVGRDTSALKQMFHVSLLPTLEQQCLRFQELNGFGNLLQTRNGAEVILNAMRSLLLLDGTATSAAKAKQMDNYPRYTPALRRLHELTGVDQGLVQAICCSLN